MWVVRHWLRGGSLCDTVMGGRLPSCSCLVPLRQHIRQRTLSRTCEIPAAMQHCVRPLPMPLPTALKLPHSKTKAEEPGRLVHRPTGSKFCPMLPSCLFPAHNTSKRGSSAAYPSRIYPAFYQRHFEASIADCADL